MTVPLMLVDEVRAEVRHRGVDPARDPVTVRQLAEEATRRHERRNRTGQAAALDDQQGVVGEIVARLSGLGPLQALLDDPEVEEIWVNSP